MRDYFECSILYKTYHMARNLEKREAVKKSRGKREKVSIKKGREKKRERRPNS